MMLRFTAAIISSWLFLSSTTAAIEQTIVQSQKLEYDGDFHYLKLNGRSQVIYEDYTLQAEHINWDREHKYLTAQGEVILFTPQAKIEADSLSFDIKNQLIQARHARVEYQLLFYLSAKKILLTPDLIQAEDAKLSSPQLPFYIDAELLKYFYHVNRNNLQLEQASLNSSLFKLPTLNLTLPTRLESKLPLEVRNQSDILNPRFQLENQNVVVGLQTRLLNDRFNRLFLQTDYHSQFGFQSGLIYEWRPASEWLSISNFKTTTFSPFQYQAIQDIFYSLPEGDIFQLSLRSNTPSLFRTLLPVQLQVFEELMPFSSEIQWVTPAYSLKNMGQVQSVIGVGYQGQSTFTGGGVLNYSSPTWSLSPIHRFRFSGEGAYLSHNLQSVVTVGSRLQLEQDWLKFLTQGIYGEKFFAYAPELSFANQDRLLWRLGSYIIWQIHEDIFWGVSGEFSPVPLKLTGMDSMLTIRQKPMITNILFTLMPFGLQTRLDFDF